MTLGFQCFHDFSVILKAVGFQFCQSMVSILSKIQVFVLGTIEALGFQFGIVETVEFLYCEGLRFSVMSRPWGFSSMRTLGFHSQVNDCRVVSIQIQD